MDSRVTLHPFGDGEYLAVLQPHDVLRHLILCRQAQVIAQLAPIDPDEIVDQALALLLEKCQPDDLPEDLNLADLAGADPGFLPELRARLTK